MEKCFLPPLSSRVGGGLERVIMRIFMGGNFAKGAWPWASSRRVMPTDQMSARWSYLEQGRHAQALVRPWQAGGRHGAIAAWLARARHADTSMFGATGRQAGTRPVRVICLGQLLAGWGAGGRAAQRAGGQAGARSTHPMVCSMTSGAIQQGVPTNVMRDLLSVPQEVPRSMVAETPKSASLTMPSVSTRMLPA